MPLLASTSRELKRPAARGHRTSLLISSFPGTHWALESIDPVHEELAANLAFVATLSVGIPPNLRPGLRWRERPRRRPASGTWNVVGLGAHFTAMLAARENGQARSEAEQAFDFVFTYDRDPIVQRAQALMLRIALSEGPTIPRPRATAETTTGRRTHTQTWMSSRSMARGLRSRRSRNVGSPAPRP
jgi:hypothetical protein